MLLVQSGMTPVAAVVASHNKPFTEIYFHHLRNKVKKGEGKKKKKKKVNEEGTQQWASVRT